MKHQYIGNTLESVAFDQYGVFDFPAQLNEEGQEIAPAKPYFTKYFSHLLNGDGKIVPSSAFDLACDKYIMYVVGWKHQDRTIRVTMPSDLATKAQVASAAGENSYLGYLGQIIDAVYPLHAQYIEVIGDDVVTYLNYIEDAHKPILLHFKEIMIEYRPLEQVVEGEINIV